MSKIVKYRIWHEEVVEDGINKILNSRGITPLRYWKDQDIHSLSPGDVTMDLSVSDYMEVRTALDEAGCYGQAIWEYTPEERLLRRIEDAEAWINRYKKIKKELEKDYFELYEKYYVE